MTQTRSSGLRSAAAVIFDIANDETISHRDRQRALRAAGLIADLLNSSEKLDRASLRTQLAAEKAARKAEPAHA